MPEADRSDRAAAEHVADARGLDEHEQRRLAARTRAVPAGDQRLTELGADEREGDPRSPRVRHKLSPPDPATST